MPRISKTTPLEFGLDQVFTKLTWLKRVAATCGIALTLLSCMHQAHALCVFSGCTAARSHSQDEASHSCQCAACSAGERCATHDCARQSCDKADCTERGEMLLDVPWTPCCPTNDEKACCQPQHPAMNHSLQVDASLMAIDAWCAPAPMSISLIVSQTNNNCRTTVSVVAPQRAIDACATLCRFLA